MMVLILVPFFGESAPAAHANILECDYAFDFMITIVL